MKKRAFGFVLAAAMLFSLVPGVAFATTAPAVTLGSYSSATSSFDSAEVTGDVKTMTVSVTGGTISNLSELSPTTQDLYNTSATFKIDASDSAEAAQAKLRSMKFSGCSSVEVTVDANTTSDLPEGANITQVGDHYYMWVNEQLSWSAAYNKAKTFKYNGMQGYLATVTSDSEYAALRAISTKGSWIGGTIMVHNDGKGTKINDDEKLDQYEGAFTYMGTSYNNTKGKAYPDYYWACGPEAGTKPYDQGVNTNANGEPNAYVHSSYSIPSGVTNILKMTKYECCLVANNGGTNVINDIIETGWSGDYSTGYFVEFGGYAEGEDPGKADPTLTTTVSYSFSHQHSWTYSEEGGKLVATCNSTEGTCDLTDRQVSLTLSATDKTYDGQPADVMVGTYAEQKAWKNAGLTVPAPEYLSKSSGYSAVDSAIAADGYTINITAADSTAKASTTLTISPAEVTVSGITAKSRTYNGATDVTLDLSGVKIDGVLDGDTVSANATGAFEDKNAGTDKKVNLSVTLSGDAASNYQIAATGSQTEATANIYRYTTYVRGITAKDKTYDGTTDAELDTSKADFYACFDGDELTLESAKGAFADANAGEGKKVAVSGVVLGGADAGNYLISASATLDDVTATISPKSIKGATVELGDALVCNREEQTQDVKSVTLADGTVLGEGDYTVSNNTASEPGDYTLTVTGTGNYTDSVTKGFTITENPDHIEYTVTYNTNGGSAVADTAASSLPSELPATTKAGATFKGWYYDEACAKEAKAGDKLSKNTTLYAKWEISEPTAAAGLVYNGSEQRGVAESDDYTLGGTSKATAAGDYTATVTPTSGNFWADGTQTAKSVAWSIAKREVTVSGIKAEDKVYNAEIDATLDFSGVEVKGLVSGEKLSATATGMFDSKHVGTDKVVKLTDIKLTGDKDVLANYQLAETGNQIETTASITPYELVITGIAAADKIYDGTADAELDLANVGFTKLSSIDDVKLVSAKGAFADADAGENKSVTVSDIVLGGAEKDDYVAVADGVTGTISPKSIEGATVELGDGLVCNDSEQTQTVTSVTLADGTVLAEGDYEVSGNTATEAGDYTLTVTGKGNYTGSVEVKFTVAHKPNPVKPNEEKKPDTDKKDAAEENAGANKKAKLAATGDCSAAIVAGIAAAGAAIAAVGVTVRRRSQA